MFKSNFAMLCVLHTANPPWVPHYMCFALLEERSEQLTLKQIQLGAEKHLTAFFFFLLSKQINLGRFLSVMMRTKLTCLETTFKEKLVLPASGYPELYDFTTIITKTRRQINQI